MVLRPKGFYEPMVRRINAEKQAKQKAAPKKKATEVLAEAAITWLKCFSAVFWAMVFTFGAIAVLMNYPALAASLEWASPYAWLITVAGGVFGWFAAHNALR